MAYRIGAVAMTEILRGLARKGVVLADEQILDIEQGRVTTDNEGRLLDTRTGRQIAATCVMRDTVKRPPLDDQFVYFDK